MRHDLAGGYTDLKFVVKFVLASRIQNPEGQILYTYAGRYATIYITQKNIREPSTAQHT